MTNIPLKPIFLICIKLSSDLNFLNIISENKEIKPARTIYKVGAFVASNVFNKYFDGIADKPKSIDDVIAGINVTLVNLVKFFRSIEKNIIAIIMTKDISNVLIDTVSDINIQPNKKVNAGAKDNKGLATLASVNSKVLK